MIQKALKELNQERVWVVRFDNVWAQWEDLETLYSLMDANEEDQGEVEVAYQNLQKALELLELQATMQKAADMLPAIVEIKPITSKSQDLEWCYTLMQMYRHWARKHAYQVQELHLPGENYWWQGALLLEVTGALAYGQLKGETGLHFFAGLVPENESNQANVFVHPLWGDELEFAINPTDIRTDTYRDTGVIKRLQYAGVRLTHLPSGVQVVCHQAGSQMANRDKALQILRARLYEKQLKTDKTRQGLSQNPMIRSYALQPDKIVQDLRTAYTCTDVSKVFQGELDGFLKVFLMADYPK